MVLTHVPANAEGSTSRAASHHRVFRERAPRRHRACWILGDRRQQLRCKRRMPHSPTETSMKEGGDETPD
jgi:hypothetical protein